MSHPKRIVRLTIEVLGMTDRDAWEWGDVLARSLKSDLDDCSNPEEFGFVAVQCVDVEDPAREPVVGR